MSSVYMFDRQTKMKNPIDTFLQLFCEHAEKAEVAFNVDISKLHDFEWPLHQQAFTFNYIFHQKNTFFFLHPRYFWKARVISHTIKTDAMVTLKFTNLGS